MSGSQLADEVLDLVGSPFDQGSLPAQCLDIRAARLLRRPPAAVIDQCQKAPQASMVLFQLFDESYARIHWNASLPSAKHTPAGEITRATGKHDDVVLAIIDGVVSLKRYWLDSNRAVLAFDNPDLPPTAIEEIGEAAI